MGSKKLRNAIKQEHQKNTPQPPKPQIRTKKKTVEVQKRPWYTILFMVAGIIVLSFIFTFMLNTVVTDMYLSDHPELKNDTAALKTAVEAFINESTIYPIIQRLIYNFAGILAMLMLFGRIEKAQFPSIYLKNNGKRGTDIGMGVLFSVLAALVAYNALTVIGYVKPTGTLVFSTVQLLWLGDVLLMTVFEELFFRGYLSYKLNNRGFNITMAVPSILFALYKGLPSQMPGTYLTYFIMGMMLTFATIKLNSVWFALTFRFMWTFVSALVLSIYSHAIPGIVENSGITANWISGNDLGFENGLIAAVILLICYLIVRKMIEGRNTKKQRKLQSDGTIR